ncbi:MAG: hypothetical protein WBX25_03645 [Rhodomicrobium sp.]
MNDAGTRDTNDVDARDRWDNPFVKHAPGKPPKQRPYTRRRWGGRLFALGALLVLAGGLAWLCAGSSMRAPPLRFGARESHRN